MKNMGRTSKIDRVVALVMIGVGEFAGIRLLQFSSGEFTGEGLIAFLRSAGSYGELLVRAILGSGAETILARLERLERSGNDPAS